MALLQDQLWLKVWQLPVTTNGPDRTGVLHSSPLPTTVLAPWSSDLGKMHPQPHTHLVSRQSAPRAWGCPLGLTAAHGSASGVKLAVCAYINEFETSLPRVVSRD